MRIRKLLDEIENNTPARNVSQMVTEQTKINISNLSHVLRKLNQKSNIKITGMGDSYMYGTGSSDPATKSYLAQITNLFQTKFGVNVTLNNRAVGGRTVALSMIEQLPSALADKADLYFISFGHNDVKSDVFVPGVGYPRENMLTGIEYIIRKIRKDVPNADIFLVGEWGYPTADATEDAVKQVNRGIAELASIYGCAYVDMEKILLTFSDRTPYFATGDTHPTDLGYTQFVNEIMKYFAQDYDFIVTQANIPATPLRNVNKYDYRNWVPATKDAVFGNRFLLNGTWTTSAPYTSSTASSTFEMTFNGSECLLDMDIENTKLTIWLDGVRLYSATTFSSGWNMYTNCLIPLDCGYDGIHTLKIYLYSGTLTLRNAYVLQSHAEVIKYNSPRITRTGTWANEGTDNHYFTGYSYSTAPTGYSYEFDFVGTGVGFQVEKNNSTIKFDVTLDGGTTFTVDAQTADGNVGSILLKNNLPYGKHHIKVAANANNTFSPRISCFFVIDNTKIEKSRSQKGIGIVGETITFPTPYTTIPTVKCFGNGVYATNVTATGFTISGTTNEQAYWEADGNIIYY